MRGQPWRNGKLNLSGTAKERHSGALHALLECLPIDSGTVFCQAGAMFRLPRKFVAVLMLLWLPLSSGNALAVSVSMEAHGTCHEMAMSDMQHHDIHPHAVRHGMSCDDCGVCHLACAGYLAVPSLELAILQLDGQPLTPYLASFHSYTPTPLDPPPLTRS